MCDKIVWHTGTNHVRLPLLSPVAPSLSYCTASAPTAILACMSKNATTCRPVTPQQRNLWRCELWHTDSRNYEITLRQDMFGIWIIERSWAGKNGKRGGKLTTEAEDHAQAAHLFEAAVKRRKQRGYVRAGEGDNEARCEKDLHL